ncbi:hypothetical protein U9726_09555 [Escherichia coli]
MNRSDSPKKQPKPFGVNGQRVAILPTTPAGDNSASYEQGFPPITMILKSAGGLPPKGQDMNQILYELSALGRWSSTGALNTFDSEFASEISGYPSGAMLISNDGERIFINTTEGNLSDPNSNGTGWKDILSYLGLGDASGYVGRLLKIQVFTASGTVTKTPGAKKWRIKCLGGGGGSSAAPATGSNEVSVSNGGGAGAYAEGIYDVSSITTASVVIGSGGAGGTADSIYGADGGTSSVGSFISSPGGKAGLPAGPANPPFQPVANTNSDGPTGWNIVGSSGAGAEPAVAVTHSYAAGSRGSNSIFGVGGSIPAMNSPANPGGGYGSGASGCSNGPSQSAKSGAAGRPGIVIIEELA